jgi:hypothetical protein
VGGYSTGTADRPATLFRLQPQDQPGCRITAPECSDINMGFSTGSASRATNCAHARICAMAVLAGMIGDKP